MINKVFRKFKRVFKLILHHGNKYKCPFCGYASKDLFSIGLNFPVLKEKEVVGGGRRPGGCYKCGSIDRERLILVYLKEKLKIFSGDKNLSILHIAPEKHLSMLLSEAGFTKYICGDLFTYGYEYPANVENIDVLSIPYANNTFDLVICNHVLEHVPQDQMAMKEIKRVMKSCGKAILQVPISKNSLITFEDNSITEPKERELNFGQFDHVRIYGQDYIKRLEESGFKVERINISKEFKKFGLNQDEDIFICIKQ